MAVPAQEAADAAPPNANTRAAAAAARVAARYAKVPSYSDLVAGEARAAVRAAEAVSRAAQEAQAAAESVLAGIEAATAAEPVWEVQINAGPASEAPASTKTALEQAEMPEARPVAQRAAWASEVEEFEERWEREFPTRPTGTALAPAVQVTALEPEIEPEYGTDLGSGMPEAAVQNLHAPVWNAPERPESEEIEMVEPAQPIHANLIEFPREIVATRKVRPRLAEGPLAATEDQLSIFEVDPSTISTEPMASGVTATAAPGWTAPEWSGIELDATPAREFYEAPPVERVQETVVVDQPVQTRPKPMTVVAMAPVHLRAMAAIVDGSLVVCALVGATLVASMTVRDLPSLHTAEVSVAIGLALICAFYHVLFYGFADSTPGMRYAGILPCTFDGRSLSRLHRFGRLIAMLVSVAPMGLGVLWALFDDERLSWHDRLSGTYLRKV